MHLRCLSGCGRLAQTRLSRDVVDNEAQARKQLQGWLRQEYGLLIDSATAAKVLGFRSAGTLSKARNRGLLALDMFPVPNRKGLYTSPKHLAAYLQATLPSQHLPTEGDSDGWMAQSAR